MLSARAAAPGPPVIGPVGVVAAEPVVLAHEQHRQPEHDRPVQRFEERAAVDGAVAEEAGDDLRPAAELQRLRGADGDGHAGGDDAVGAEHPDREIGDVHRPALALVGAGGLAEELAPSSRLTSAPLASVWPWPRCVEVSRSSRVRLAHTPAATASCPVDRCSGPRTSAGVAEVSRPQACTPPWLATSAASSNARMRAIVRYRAARRCAWGGIDRGAPCAGPGSPVAGVRVMEGWTSQYHSRSRSDPSPAPDP